MLVLAEARTLSHASAAVGDRAPALEEVKNHQVEGVAEGFFGSRKIGHLDLPLSKLGVITHLHTTTGAVEKQSYLSAPDN